MFLSERHMLSYTSTKTEYDYEACITIMHNQIYVKKYIFHNYINIRKMWVKCFCDPLSISISLDFPDSNLSM